MKNIRSEYSGSIIKAKVRRLIYPFVRPSSEDPVQLQCLLPAGGDRRIHAHLQRSVTGQGEALLMLTHALLNFLFESGGSAEFVVLFKNSTFSALYSLQQNFIICLSNKQKDNSYSD